MFHKKINGIICFEFVRFLFVGFVNTLFFYGVFATGICLGLGYIFSTSMATIVGVVFNFQSIGRLVFKKHDTKLFFKFIFVYIVCYLLNISLQKIQHSIGIDNDYMAGAIAAAPISIITYSLMRNFVFKDEGCRFLDNLFNNKIKDNFLSNFNKNKLFLFLFVMLHFAIFSLVGVWRYWGNMSSLNDLGCFDQAIWTALNNNALLNTFIYGREVNWLGFHFEPILYIFVPLYYIIPTVKWLIIGQSLALSVTAIPIYLLAYEVTKSGKQALLWSITYLVNPYLNSAAAWDFHEMSLAVPFIALSLLAIEKQRPILFTLACLILLLCKEHMGMTVALLGVVYGVKNQQWRIGLITMLSGSTAMILILGVIMPEFSPTKQHVMFSENLDQLSRYSWLGHSPSEMMETLITSPGYVFNKLIYEHNVFRYFQMLLSPFLFTSLLAPFSILPAGADLLANTLSENNMPRGIVAYHSVGIIPVLVVAAIYGSQRLPSARSMFTRERMTRYICCSSLILGYVYAPLPLPFMKNYWQPVQYISSYDHRIEHIRYLIGMDSVSVQANVGAYFTQRNHIYLFPKKFSQSDFIIINLSSPTRELRGPYVGSLQHHLQMKPKDYLNAIESLLNDDRFKVIYWSDPWLVFGKNNMSIDDEVSLSVIDKIQELRRDWLTPFV